MQRDHEAWESAETARTVVRPQEIVTVRLMNVSEESKLLNDTVDRHWGSALDSCFR